MRSYKLKKQVQALDNDMIRLSETKNLIQERQVIDKDHIDKFNIKD